LLIVAASAVVFTRDRGSAGTVGADFAAAAAKVAAAGLSRFADALDAELGVAAVEVLDACREHNAFAVAIAALPIGTIVEAVAEAFVGDAGAGGAPFAGVAGVGVLAGEAAVAVDTDGDRFRAAVVVEFATGLALPSFADAADIRGVTVAVAGAGWCVAADGSDAERIVGAVAIVAASDLLAVGLADNAYFTELAARRILARVPWLNGWLAGIAHTVGIGVLLTGIYVVWTIIRFVRHAVSVPVALCGHQRLALACSVAGEPFGAWCRGVARLDGSRNALIVLT
jgi:hypothetical protein